MPENIQSAAGHQYFLQKKIAQGGMAEIYKGLASDIHGIKKTVVIKKILPHIAANREFVDMLVSEAKIAVQLSHGNIAQIYDLGRIGNDYFMVMEFVDGKSLSQIHKRCLKDGTLMPLQYACYFVSEVAGGLDYMHKKTDEAGKSLGIVHRDISPQNIIISYSGTVKIIDFGIAKAAFKLDATESGILKGKFAYMSPEQARGEDIDSRSDIFSLGVILYETISGRRLFKDKDNKATIRNVRKTHVETPSTYNPDIPEELDRIVMKALVKDRDRRYQEAGEMRNDLVKFLHQDFQGFKPSSITEFIHNIFSEDIGEEEPETEQTPLLIIDQTQSAILTDRPHVMKEFMLEEEKKTGTLQKAGGQALVQKRRSALAHWRTSALQKAGGQVWTRLERLKPIIIKYVIGTAIVIAVAGLVFAGWKLGWWRAWSAFLKPVGEVQKEEAPVKFTTIIVESEPAGAKIFIDNEEISYKTPATVTNIRADSRVHTIGLFLDNHKFFNTTFTASPDDTVRFRPTLEAAYGALEIISYPETADVIINDEKTGTTPFMQERLAPGSILNIRLEKEGYTAWEVAIKIIPDQTVTLRPQLLHLPRKPGEVSVPIPKIIEPAAPSAAETQTEKFLPPTPLINEPPKSSASPAPETPLNGPVPQSRETPLELDYR